MKQLTLVMVFQVLKLFGNIIVAQSMWLQTGENKYWDNHRDFPQE